MTMGFFTTYDTGQLTSSSMSSILYFPSSLFTYIRPDGLLTEMPNCHSNNHGTVPIYRRQALSGLCTILAANGTAFGSESTTTASTEGAPMAEGLPEEANGIGQAKKTTEIESRSSLSTVNACFPPTNQIAALRLRELAIAP